MPLRREPAFDDYPTPEEDDDAAFTAGSRASGVHLRFNGGVVPRTLWGRIAAGCAAAIVLGSAVALLLVTRSFLLHDEHFVIPGPSAIQIAGNEHLTRAQLLSVFGEDVERNIFNMPLAERRTELERLPWVEHATVMRLLPNRIHVAIVERTPVAFVRQGKEIGLVDAHGVLLDLTPPVAGDANAPASAAQYSFPVLTGIVPADPLSTRAARMKIYTGFMEALDAGGEKVSRRLSEVDLSNPEDVKAILPDGAGTGADVLVHFGDEKFLERYRLYQQHLAEWRTQYPRLSAVDMRYERQVVLETHQEATASLASPSEALHPAPLANALKTRPAPHAGPLAAKASRPTGKPPAKPAAVASPPGVSPDAGEPVHHLTTAFSVPSALPAKASAKSAAAAKSAAQGGPR